MSTYDILDTFVREEFKLNNDNFNNYDNNESDFVSQQLPPGRFRPNQPPFGGERPPFRDDEEQDMPRMGGQPLSPPPNFTPEMPRMEREQTFGAPDQFGAQYRGGRQQYPPVFNRRCLNRYTFIWLINGNSFWFFPTFIGWQHIEGFRWRNGRWVYDRINLRRIIFSTCF